MFTLWIRGVNSPPEIGEDVISVDWLPAEATNINYYRSYVFTAYEFQISEAGFRKWAVTVAYESSEHVSYQPVSDLADFKEKRFFTIERYNRFIGEDEDLDYSEHLKATSRKIENGLRGEMRRGSGGGYSIGYDRDTLTAYWQSNPR